MRLVLPDDLHFDLKRQALEERLTLTALLIKALHEYLNNQRRTQKDEEKK